MTTGQTTRRGVLGRGLILLAGLGAAVAGRPGLARGARRGSLVLYGRNWRGYGLPLDGDRPSLRGDLLARPDGDPVGEFVATAFAFGGAAHPAQAERLELHTFKLAEGSIFGTGTVGGLEGAFSVLGGTGRYAGARGTYVARQEHPELGGDGAAQFVFDLH